MSKRLESLRAQLAELDEKQTELRSKILAISDAHTDKPIEGDQAVEYRSLNEEFDGVLPQIRAIEAEVAQLERIVNAPERAKVPGAPTFMERKVDPLKDETVMYGPVDQVRGAARTAIENIPLADDNVRGSLYRTLETADSPSGNLARHMIAASRPEYRSAFSKMITGRSYALTAEEIRAVDHVRAASLTDAAGGALVPTVLDPTLIISGTHDGLTPNVMRQLANVRQITGDNLNLVSTAGVTATWAAEGTEATDDAPSFSTLTITPYKAHVNVPHTYEIAADWPAMESEMRRLMMIAKDDAEIEAFTTGNGTLKPLGLFYDIYTNYTGQVQASAGSNVFAEADLYALIQKVAYRWRNRGVWVGNEIIFDKVRQLNVASAGSVSVQLAADRPGTILGRPAYGNPQVDGTYGSGENYVLAYGDVREAYTIVDRLGMAVELHSLLGSSNNLPNGMRSLYAYWRTGARVTNSGAVAVLNVT